MSNTEEVVEEEQNFYFFEGSPFNPSLKQFWLPNVPKTSYVLRNVVLKKTVDGTRDYYSLGYQAVIYMNTTPPYPEYTLAIDFRPEINRSKRSMYKMSTNMVIDLDDCSSLAIEALAPSMAIFVRKPKGDFIPSGIYNQKIIMGYFPEKYNKYV